MRICALTRDLTMCKIECLNRRTSQRLARFARSTELGVNPYTGGPLGPLAPTALHPGGAADDSEGRVSEVGGVSLACVGVFSGDFSVGEKQNRPLAAVQFPAISVILSRYGTHWNAGCPARVA